MASRLDSSLKDKYLRIFRIPSDNISDFLYHFRDFWLRHINLLPVQKSFIIYDRYDMNYGMPSMRHLHGNNSECSAKEGNILMSMDFTFMTT